MEIIYPCLLDKLEKIQGPWCHFYVTKHLKGTIDDLQKVANELWIDGEATFAVWTIFDIDSGKKGKRYEGHTVQAKIPFLASNPTYQDFKI